MRAIVIRESLTSSNLPTILSSGIFCEYQRELNEQLITIVESVIDPSEAEVLALELSRLLKDQSYYAHLVDADRMLIAFPRTLVEVRRDQRADERIAQAVGRVFSIPPELMCFLAMFANDHPDVIPQK